MKSSKLWIVTMTLSGICTLGAQEPRPTEPARQDPTGSGAGQEPRSGQGETRGEARSANQGESADASATTAARAPSQFRKPSDLLGRTVVDAEGNRLGAIKNVALDLEQGRIAYAIVSAGSGDLGVNTRTIAVPWTALRSSPAENGAGTGAKTGGVVTGSERIILDMTSARLKEAPAFDENDWSTLTNERTAMGLHTFYGVQPYWGSGAGMGAGRGGAGTGREGTDREGAGREGAGTGREAPTGREGEGTGTGTGGTGESGTGQGGREQPGTGGRGTGEGNRERPGTGERGTGGRGREGSGSGGRSGGSGTGSGGGRSGAGGSGSGGGGGGR